MTRQERGDTGGITRIDVGQLRRAGTVLAGSAGAGLGVLLGIAWLSFRDGDTDTGVALLVIGLLFAMILLFLVAQTRLIARIASAESRTHGHEGLERRLLELEIQVHARSRPREEPGDRLELVEDSESPVDT